MFKPIEKTIISAVRKTTIRSVGEKTIFRLRRVSSNWLLIKGSARLRRRPSDTSWKDQSIKKTMIGSVNDTRISKKIMNRYMSEITIRSVNERMIRSFI